MKHGFLASTMLALGVFSIITTEIGIVGVLPELADRADVSISQAGLLVSVFALVVAVSGPFGVLAASRFNRKTVLLLAMAVFALANIVYAFSESFPVLVAFRIIPALLHPIFFAVALTAATSMAQPGKEAGAAARVFTGVTVGFAFGVPAMAFLASSASVPTAFSIAALVNVLAFIGIALWVPAMPSEQHLSYGKQLQILRRPRLWLQLIIVTLVFAVMFSSYSYFSDFLGGVSGVPSLTIGALLMLFGLVMIAGNLAFARLIKHGLLATLLWFLGGYVALYLVMYAVAPSAWAISILVIPWSLLHSGGLLLGQSLIARESTEAPTFGNSLFVSSSNIGITLGSALGALQIAAAGTRSLVFVGVGAALLALLAVGVSHLIRGREKAPQLAQHE
ncbi:MFS transporter [Galactobacter caseinivorans]|uniref:MFS transporter n=1 Tax=Galactobacter caseinivorans TaxID=2676123 RepID=A0A496PJ25_9MICC|nr:MFS transporter [Galactobacter caseinivorans]RKW70512.1 MFS transporter [Galactobacter caseinivorans]